MAEALSQKPFLPYLLRLGWPAWQKNLENFRELEVCSPSDGHKFRPGPPGLA